MINGTSFMYVEHRNRLDKLKSLINPEALNPTCEWGVSAVIPSIGNGIDIHNINTLIIWIIQRGSWLT